MLRGQDYVREIQKFTTSQYWNAGVRITAGVMVPTLILAHQGWLATGMPFLWGALFVSLTDTPGPIHHRRNGMLAAIAFNAVTVLLTSFTRDYQFLLLAQVVILSFFYSLLGVFGARASAVGTLALVIMLLNLVPHNGYQNGLKDMLLIAAGGFWYTGFSLLLYRLRPYRLAEQAIGESLIVTADYIRARGAFYKEDADVQACFTRMMEEQIQVHNIQDQTRDLLFKTRQFVVDASPKSRSMMMLFLDSIDLFEQTLSSYQNYESLHKHLGETGLLNKLYGAILQVAAELEHIGLSVQAGNPVKKQPDLTRVLHDLEEAIRHQKNILTDADKIASLYTLGKILSNIRNITNRMHRLAMYTRLEIDTGKSYLTALDVSKFVVGTPVRWQLIRENLTLKSNTFRYALRLAIGMIIGYGTSLFLSLSHMYWVLLTIVTILKPVYATTRKRNIERVAGTIAGALLALGLLAFIRENTILLALMIFSMLLSYSFLRVNYFAFVLFLTVYIIITFHFLSPDEFGTLIKERVLDTVIGSVIAAVISRFVLPAWGHEEIETSMRDVLNANQKYFIASWNAVRNNNLTGSQEYKLARQSAIVALTNLTDNFQRMLAEPKQSARSPQVHQFVIANHMLTGHIAALSSENLSREIVGGVEPVVKAVEQELQLAEENIRTQSPADITPTENPLAAQQTLNQLSIIYSLVRDIKIILHKMYSQ